MAVSQSDMPHFNTKSGHHDSCEPTTNELDVANVTAPSWSKDIKSSQDGLWPRFPFPSGLPPATAAECDDWSSYSRTECKPPVLLGEGDTKTVDPSVQSVDKPTSGELSPPSSFQRTVAECAPVDSERLSRHTVLPGTRSPTVGGESRSGKTDSHTGRSLEHLTAMHDTVLMDRTTVLSKSFGASCVGDVSDGLSSKRALSAYYDVQTCLKTQQSAPITSSLVTVNEERGLHQPDGADHPDEHMWFYEDPQGRTQGSFSDAQMHDWLSEGIYFTEGLRVRRKCDDTFSTLAQYCQLFGRIPFHAGPRIPPIVGGITPHTLVTGSQVECFGPSTQARVGAAQGPIGNLASSPGQTTAGAATLSSAASSGPHTAGHRNPYKLDPESAVRLTNRFGSSTTDEDRSSASKTASGLYFNNSPSAVQNRFSSFPQARPPLVPHDLPAQGSASLSPSLLSALAPFLAPLSSQTTGTVGPAPPVSATATTPVSPMQQLAETAQLAAQLAAMASAHSPDQTPMQPTQALALAEMLISTHLSPINWPSQLKKESSFGVPGEFRMEQAGANATTAGSEGLRTPAGLHSHGGFPDDVTVKQSSSLITGSSSGGLGTSNRATFDGDGKVSTKATRDMTSSKQQRPTEATRNNRSVHPLKSQPNMGSSGSNIGSSIQDSDCNHAGSSHARQEGQMSFADSLQRAVNPQSASKRTTGGTIVNESHLCSANHPGKVSASKSHAGGHSAGCESETKKRASNKLGGKDDRQTAHTAANGLYRPDANTTPLKGTANQKSGSAATAQVHAIADKVQSPVKSQTDPSNSSEAVSSVPTMRQLSEAAQEELELLTQWSIGRLGSLPMREKVDIPTVVELLATLDAPYEVERMVSTFLGESARAAQFVKDFLDHRRPFWKLHRQLRENSIVVGQPPSVNAVSMTNNHVSCDSATHNTAVGTASTTCRSGERASAANSVSSTVNSKKKKRSGASSAGGTMVTSTVGTNHILQHQSSGAGGDFSADNQWHHIKPKNSLNRKANKGGDRKIPS